MHIYMIYLQFNFNIAHMEVEFTLVFREWSE